MIDLERVVAIAQEAGQLALADWQPGEPNATVREKAPGQPVCDSDLAVNAFLRERLSPLLPEAGWLSEETVNEEARRAKELAWVVDPIDGTRDYVRGRPGWCVSVALVRAGEPVLGVLVAPARDEVWMAEAGQGAWRNGTAIATGSHNHARTARMPIDRRPTNSDVIVLPKPNSIALRIGMVAADEADLVLTARWGHEWDIAAAHCIVREAGGILTDAMGQPLRYNGSTGKAFGIICCPPVMHVDAIEMIRPYAEEALARSPG